MPNETRPALPDRVLDAVATALLALAAAVALLQVFYRYALDNALPWPEELAQLAFVWAMFIAAGVATGRRGHIAIEVFSRVLTPRGRTAHRLFVDAASVATGTVLLIEGVRLVSRTTYVTPGLGLPMQVLHAAVPVGGLLIAAFALNLLLRAPDIRAEGG
jgi:C4-dicarboxylate transporter DctM subunit